MRDERSQTLRPRRRWPFGGCLTTVIVLACLLLSWWLIKAARVWQVALTENSYCRVHFYCWYSGDCTLDFYRDGAHVGRTVLGRGLFTHPWAVFPGPDGQSVVCFSWLDATFAAFTVDLRQRTDAAVPRVLEEAVERSDFPVRACTHVEVEFVADLIADAEPSHWASHLYVDELPADLERDRCQSFLRLATMPNLWRNRSLDGAPPKILSVD